MNKVLLPFLILLVFSMGIVSNVEQSSGAQNLDNLIIIAKNAQIHVKSDLDKIENTSPKILALYGDTTSEFEKLASSVEQNDVSSAREYFISVMTKLKQISYYLAKQESQKLQEQELPDQIYVIQKFETNISKIRTISTNLNVDVGAGELESLLSLAKDNYAKGDTEKAEQTLEKLAVKGIQAYNILNEINKQNQIIRAKIFAERYLPQINNLITIAKNQQLQQTVEKLEESKIQLVSSNSTQQIKNNIKLILVLKNQIEAADPIPLETQKVMLKKKLQELNDKAMSLSKETIENKAAIYWLERTFSLINYTESLIDNSPQSAYNHMKEIDKILIKVEKLIYSST
jgi:hypothetical protein